jgi:drug/metabolite transporter (DMT)-like permease
MAYLLALLAACAFALGTVLQQKGTLDVPGAEDDPRFLTQILREPIWLAGAGCQLAGWILQAAALDRGPLVVVQALVATSLVIALPLGARITGQRITRRVAFGAAAVVAGVVLFLAVGSPQAGTSTPTAVAWWSACLSSAAILGSVFLLARRTHGATKALAFGSAAGIAFALQAAVTKEFVTLVGNGLDTLLTSWTTYVLIASALVGFVLQQSALRTGVLAPAMASSNAMTLFASVVLGVAVFDEALSHGNGQLAPAIIGVATALAGIVLLASAKPPTRSGSVPLTARPGERARESSR